MNNKLLKEKLIELQLKYKEVLEKSIKGDLIYAIEEINIFWFKNRKLVKFILNNLSRDFNTFVFTGATYLDVRCNEHFPFIVLGNEHIIDDPLNKFAGSMNMISNEDSREEIKKQIRLTIEDNLSILNNYNDIYILPVTYLADSKDDFIKNGSESVLLSLFKESTTMKEIFNNFSTLDELVNAMREELLEGLIFCENEDRTKGIIERFNEYRSTIKLPYSDASDIAQFIFTLMGFFAQALHILAICVRYQFIPYLRYDVTFYYFMSLGSIFNKGKEFDQLFIKAQYAYLLYKLFDFSKVAEMSFNDYVQRIQDKGISEQFLLKLDKQGNKQTLEEMKQNIRTLLNEIY
nr:hypothetical protein [uncultured Cellulosilyticum sp.]